MGSNAGHRSRDVHHRDDGRTQSARTFATWGSRPTRRAGGERAGRRRRGQSDHRSATECEIEVERRPDGDESDRRRRTTGGDCLWWSLTPCAVPPRMGSGPPRISAIVAPPHLMGMSGPRAVASRLRRHGVPSRCATQQRRIRRLDSSVPRCCWRGRARAGRSAIMSTSRRFAPAAAPGTPVSGLRVND